MNLEEKYFRIYVHIRENAYFQTLRPKGAVTPPIDICPPNYWQNMSNTIL